MSYGEKSFSHPSDSLMNDKVILGSLGKSFHSKPPRQSTPPNLDYGEGQGKEWWLPVNPAERLGLIRQKGGMGIYSSKELVLWNNYILPSGWNFGHQGSGSPNHWVTKEFLTTPSKVLHEEASCLPNVYHREKKEVLRELFSTRKASNARNGQPGNITMIITLTSGFIEHLPFSKQHSKYFVFINSFKPTTIQVGQGNTFSFLSLLKGQPKRTGSFCLKKPELEDTIISSILWVWNLSWEMLVGVWIQIVWTPECELISHSLKAIVDYPGGHVVKNLPAKCRGHGLHPWSPMQRSN